MKANRRVRRGNKPSRLMITPMIDIVFQLVLYLLVSATFPTKPALDISLAESSTSKGSETFELVVYVDAAGKISLNGEDVSMEQLVPALNIFDSRYPVTVEADEKTTNGTIVKIFDKLAGRGFSEVNLRTREND
nr:biopolymer transporter ExbD [Treponema sp.]